MSNWYQNILGFENVDHPERSNSIYWGQGKWDTFIRPLIPYKYFDDKTFVELGCNAGLYLLNAKKFGFKHVIGIEPQTKFYNQACKVLEKYNNLDILLRQETVGINHKQLESTDKIHNLNSLPLADITLLANVHYWIEEKNLIRYLTELSYHSRYCIVVGIGKRDNTPSCPDRNNTIKYFGFNWKFINEIEPVKVDDPAPRYDTYSMLFESKNLYEKPLFEFYNEVYKLRDANKYFFDYFNGYISEALKNSGSTKRDEYLYYLQHKPIKSSSLILSNAVNRIKKDMRLIQDIKNFGLKTPIEIPRNLSKDNAEKIDGYHRLAILNQLNYKHVLYKII